MFQTCEPTFEEGEQEKRVLEIQPCFAPFLCVPQNSRQCRSPTAQIERCRRKPRCPLFLPPLSLNPFSQFNSSF
ncbi:hypothetical protein RIF29_25635 [Crotalaria pallida]|uniref:Uncharacterized protein n=1 Tax=Crotalaria pallida TaxID=3830 RepID=A0AAN9ELW3_CROPI